MDNIEQFTRLAARDAALLGLGGCLLGWLLFSEIIGWSFLAGCLWMALNLILMGWLIGALTAAKRPGGLTILLLECAKIPAAYLLLYWLCTRKFFEPIGLVAGLATLPVVILLRGLASRVSHPTGQKRS